MAKITDRKLDPISKLEIVYFEDKFGAKSIVQHIITRTRVQRDADEAAHLALLENNEVAFQALKDEQGGN
jgi:tRNA(Glu) U13 pseudouridine synthase TruD